MQKELLKITLDTESKSININYGDVNKLSYHFAGLAANALARNDYALFNFLYNSLAQVLARDMSGTVQEAVLSSLDKDVAGFRKNILEKSEQKS